MGRSTCSGETSLFWGRGACSGGEGMGACSVGVGLVLGEKSLFWERGACSERKDLF